MALSNTDKPVDEQDQPKYEISQDWSMYGLEELRGVRDSYKDKLKVLDRYSKSYEDLSDVLDNVSDVKYVKDLASSYKRGTFGNINVANRQEYEWTLERMQ